MIVDKSTRDLLLKVYEETKVSLEGNIIKVFEADPTDTEFAAYLSNALERDRTSRKNRLDITKQVQKANVELNKTQIELKEALSKAELAKSNALNDLDILQKRTQTELMGTITKVAMAIIVSSGVFTSILYGLALYFGKDTTVIGPAWSNNISILVTNSFSILATIMGIKYFFRDNKNQNHRYR